VSSLNDNLLRASACTFSYGNGKTKGSNDNGKIVIENINFELARGEVIAIHGANGCGKSTLMKGLARQLKPVSGNVTLNGKDIWQTEISAFARQIAYVPQSLERADMTVHELVALGRNPHQKWWSTRLSEKEDSTVCSALARCGMTPLQDKKFDQLSGGEKQRAVIAMALAQEPQFILMDEPTASLDFHYQLELIAIIKELKDQGIGIAIILHDLNLSARIADQIALIGKTEGRAATLLARGPVKEVLNAEMLRSVFAVDLSIIHDHESDQDYYFPRAIAPNQ
jgi:iron complex transport system ATP-binding protein